jgi:hypothetical protein
MAPGCKNKKSAPERRQIGGGGSGELQQQARARNYSDLMEK